MPEAQDSGPQACVIGWPVAHSRSPLIHGYWLEKYDLPGRYDKQAVPPEDFPEFLDRFAESGLIGANVTVPHKELAYELVDRREPAAEAVQAVNTIWLDDGQLVGDNTDVYGFLANLDEGAPGWDGGSRAAVIGAGGAARAVLKGLIDRGFSEIRLANRTFAKAQGLAEAFGPAVRAIAWAERDAMLDGCALLVNTTSLGMEGSPALEIDLAALPSDAVVTDIVYVPLQTPLLRAAKARGLRTVDGLGMLLHQAVPGFARWFGVRPEVTPELRARIVADIEQDKAAS
ncbi:shikimate dehydrogenase [Dichotomicrobium thermohalophilum]|uniref:Shikimate dehydrogenase (NADP(+)) n=1 Tax=Dichotomicrobium thermohalophilum TaxID=933063 RepID=A0A397Q444_9HYPH|nr:shikimate dehydrogenase [Dichotomicrobium thermohalophilum]RIA55179.1 shikimate dehydrogenase [Dichotomicrobium thermohalophilum]